MRKVTTDVVRARRIEVVDYRGVVRAVLDTVQEHDFDAVKLGLCAPDGREHVTLYCDDVNGGLELWEKGNQVANLSSNRDGTSGVLLSSDDGSPVAALVNEGGPVVLENPVPFTLRLFRVLRISGTATVRDDA